MRGRTIFLVASLAFPIIATPVPTDQIDAREVVVERRSEFSIAQLYRNLFKREPLIEALPEQASYEVVDRTKRITLEDSVEVGDNDEVVESPDSLTKRRMKNAGGGPRGRAIVSSDAELEERGRMKNPGGGPGKRSMKNAGGGPGKRSMKNAGGGPGKRSMKNAGGGPGKRSMKNGGGGPGR